MNTKRVRSLLVVLAVAALTAVLTSPASGTFPGKNGRIDFIFAPSNPANMLGNAASRPRRVHQCRRCADLVRHAQQLHRPYSSCRPLPSSPLRDSFRQAIAVP
jgi:hypothetical protein